MAKTVGIRKGLFTGLSLGSLMLVMFSMYGLAFWYGSTLVVAGEINEGQLLTAFFGVLIGAFSLAQVGCCCSDALPPNDACYFVKPIRLFTQDACQAFASKVAFCVFL